MRSRRPILGLYYIGLPVLLVLLFLGLESRGRLEALTPQHWGGAKAPTGDGHDGHNHSHDKNSPPPVATEAIPLGPIPCLAGFAGPYLCHNVDLLAFVPTNSLVGSTGADIWGWTDPVTGKRYAVSSHSNATSFVDVSDPTSPIFLGYLPAPVTNVLWRDVKVYANHAYIVGDGDFVGPHGLQIFDLTTLRDVAQPPVVFDQTAHYNGFGNAHNIAINEATGVAYVVGSNSCAGGPHMLDLSQPAQPAFLGCYSGDGYTHDAQCVLYHGPDAAYQGREICFLSNEDTLTIVDVTDKQAPQLLARQGYAGFSYTHQGWLTGDHAYFVLGDETDELDNLHNTHSYLWDVRDLTAPVHFATHVGPTAAIDHNLYIRGRYVYQSNYTAGLRILDAADIANGRLPEIAYFDTHPADDATAFAGTWSNYPFFGGDSGVPDIVIVSNIEDGLYILRPNLPEEPGGDDGQASGGGYLLDAGGQKINFGFTAERSGAALSGSLQLNDKAAGVKIHLTDLSELGDASGSCGSVPAAANALAFSGHGRFNDSPNAQFRVCVQDNGEPGHGSDLFYLECVAGCSYSTGGRTADDVIDGGNIQVRRSAGGDAGQAATGPSTLILDPLLLTEGAAGLLQTFSVTALDAGQAPLADAAITLTRTAADGSLLTLTGVTDLTGTAVFSAANLAQPAEYIASAGDLSSNAVDIGPPAALP